MQECLIFKKGWEPVTQGTGELLKLLSPHFSKGGPEWIFNRLVCLAHIFLCCIGNTLFVLKGGMSHHTHAPANYENKLEKVGPSFSSSVGDFGRLFLSV